MEGHGQSRGRLEPPAAGRGRKDPPRRLWREHSPATLGFQASAFPYQDRRRSCAVRPLGLCPQLQEKQVAQLCAHGTCSVCLKHPP